MEYKIFDLSVKLIIKYVFNFVKSIHITKNQLITEAELNFAQEGQEGIIKKRPSL